MKQTEKILVTYKSKTGFVKKYATWIAEELHCAAKESKDVTLLDLHNCDTIIYGGSLYAVGINGVDLIKKNFEILKEKKICVFAVGATPPREEDMEKVWEKNFTDDQRKVIHNYYYRGGFDYSKLNKVDKVLMSMMKFMLKHSKNKTEDGKGMVELIEHPTDFTDKKNIIPLLEFVREELL